MDYDLPSEDSSPVLPLPSALRCTYRSIDLFSEEKGESSSAPTPFFLAVPRIEVVSSTSFA